MCTSCHERNGDGLPTGCWPLVRAVQQRDMNAFGTLYQQYFPAVYGYLLTRSVDRNLVEDLTSETFARALANIGQVRDQGKDLRAWLFTIARNALRDETRSVRRHREVVVEELPARLISVAGPEDEVEAKIVGEEVMSRVGELSAEQRLCLYQRVLAGCSVGETARSMGRSPGAVRALHYRAVNRLRALCRPDGERVTRRKERTAPK